MLRAFRSSLTFKLLASLALASVFPALLASWIIASHERDILRDDLARQGRTLANYLAMLSRDPLIEGDSVQLDGVVKEITKDPDVLFAYVFDPDGRAATSLYASANFQYPGLREAVAAVAAVSNMLALNAALEAAKAGEAGASRWSPRR